MKRFMKITPIFLLGISAALMMAGNCGCSEKDGDNAGTPPEQVQPGTTGAVDNDPKAVPAAKNPQVKMETTMGDIVVELYPEAAPQTVKNFLQYVAEGYYAGTIFHRVISEFMIQGGGITVDLTGRSPRDPIVNESDNGLKNVRGALAMSRNQNQSDSATCMFYINQVDNFPLDHGHELSPDGFGYTVFGKVLQGMDVVDRIAAVPVTNKGALFEHLPIVPVVVTKVSVIN